MLAAAVAAAAAPFLGMVALALAVALLAWSLLRQRPFALYVAAALVWGCFLALVWHFVTDQFELQLVWLYSSPALPLHLKLAGILGGDEGATLLLAALLLAFAARDARKAGDTTTPARYVSTGVAAFLLLLALWLAPFAPTPPDQLAQMPYQGMNAHLQKIWMVIHPPLVLLAYAWTLALAAPALSAVAGLQPTWPPAARLRARRAWLLMSAGIGAGMVWAFEDAMYGQIWHWDPVQTAVFCLWCFLGAHLHGVVGWKFVRRRSWLMPWTGLLAAAMAPLAMAVTRNPLLASSHRYIGAESWKAHVVLALVLLLAGVVAAFAGWRRRRAMPAVARKMRPASELGLWLAQWALLLAGLVAAALLAWALMAEAAGVPRPDRYKPFLALVAKLTRGAQLDALLQAFDQWEVDGYMLAQLLLLPLLVLGLVGGWYFLRRLSRRAGWISLAAVLAAMAWIGVDGGLLTHWYRGDGLLSQHIVRFLPVFDAALAAGAYLAFACLAWAIYASGKAGWRGAAASLPIGAIHAGIVIMFFGGMVAIGLNSYSQHEMVLDGTQTEWVRTTHDYAFRLADLQLDSSAADGGWHGEHGIRALTTIEVRDPQGMIRDGQTLYRDNRAPAERFNGPVRQMCEFLDYRYARHVMTPGYLLNPLIDRRWARSVQFWISPADVVGITGSSRSTGQVVAVVKVFPLMSVLWSGLVVTLGGGLWLALERRRTRRT